MKEIAKNKKALFDFSIIETYEAGIVLKGSEVKSIRAARVNLKDSFVRVIKNELFLLNAHIAYLATTNAYYKPDERAARKLLMHKKQIAKLHSKVTLEGYTIVPISLYLNSKNLVKVKIALAKGKNLHDKRETLKKKDMQREAKSALSNALKGKIKW
ncbi:MAG: SsrA-binding protein SmpB [Campylobacter sp.]|nr:SsrA-binding protein SmpB [Campylobacter sp.]